MLTVIDTRDVPGTCGTADITLYQVKNINKRCYRVELVSHGVEVFRKETTDQVEATQAYLHLFADPAVPNIFSDTPVEDGWPSAEAGSELSPEEIEAARRRQSPLYDHEQRQKEQS